MLEPPVKGEVSDETLTQYEKEKFDINDLVRRNSAILESGLRKIDGVKVSDLEGGWYAFPELMIPEKALL